MASTGSMLFYMNYILSILSCCDYVSSSVSLGGVPYWTVKVSVRLMCWLKHAGYLLIYIKNCMCTMMVFFNVIVTMKVLVVERRLLISNEGKIPISWDMMPCHLDDGYQHFREPAARVIQTTLNVGHSRFLWNIDLQVPDYTMSHSKR